MCVCILFPCTGQLDKGHDVQTLSLVTDLVQTRMVENHNVIVVHMVWSMWVHMVWSMWVHMVWSMWNM